MTLASVTSSVTSLTAAVGQMNISEIGGEEGGPSKNEDTKMERFPGFIVGGSDPAHTTYFLSNLANAGFFAFKEDMHYQMHPIDPQLFRMIEAWLWKKICDSSGENILLEHPQKIAKEIMFELMEGGRAFEGLFRVHIKVLVGHVYNIDVIDDELEICGETEEFFQKYPLFMKVIIKVQSGFPSTTRHPPCQVLVEVTSTANVARNDAGCFFGGGNVNAVMQ